MRILLGIVALLSVLVSSEEVCEIFQPVGVWARNNVGKKCDVVKGPFFLDPSVAFSPGPLFAVFSNLSRIEGCVYLKTRTRLTEMSFLSNLKEVICTEEKASDWGFSDTLYLKDPKLNKLGFASLQKVEGVGTIQISFGDAYISTWDDMLNAPNGTKCFTEKEIRFFAQHPMYSGLIWKDCNQGPCTTTRFFDEKIPIDHVPQNCTLFIGSILMNGFFDFPILENLEILVGNIQIIGTFLQDLSSFPKLQTVYNSYGETRGSYTIEKNNGEVQLFILVNTTFLLDFSIPSLRTDRKILFAYTAPLMIASIEPGVKLLDPCKDFPGAPCEVQYSRVAIIDNTPQLDREYYICLAVSILGLLITFRATCLLLWMRPGSFLPSTRWMLGLIYVTIVLVEIERIGFYQREMSILNEKGSYVLRYLPLLHSSQIISPFVEFYQLFAVAAKHAVLPTFLLIALDYGLFYKMAPRFAKRCSHLVLFASLLISVLLFLFLFPHLYYTIRTIEKPEAELVYGQSQQYFIPLVQDDQSSLKNRTVPGDIKVYTDDLQGSDTLGDVFTGYLFYADGIVGYSFLVLSLIRLSDRFSTPIEFFLLLYLHLSINRIRWYWKDVSYPKYCAIPNEFSAVCKDSHPFQLILMKILEKLPHISFLIVSIQCFRFARSQLFLAHVFDYRKKSSLLQLSNQSVSSASMFSIFLLFSFVFSQGQSDTIFCKNETIQVKSFLNLTAGDYAISNLCYKKLLIPEDSYVVADFWVEKILDTSEQDAWFVFEDSLGFSTTSDEVHMNYNNDVVHLPPPFAYLIFYQTIANKTLNVGRFSFDLKPRKSLLFLTECYSVDQRHFVQPNGSLRLRADDKIWITTTCEAINGMWSLEGAWPMGVRVRTQDAVKVWLFHDYGNRTEFIDSLHAIYFRSNSYSSPIILTTTETSLNCKFLAMSKSRHDEFQQVRLGYAVGAAKYTTEQEYTLNATEKPYAFVVASHLWYETLFGNWLLPTVIPEGARLQIFGGIPSASDNSSQLEYEFTGTIESPQFLGGFIRTIVLTSGVARIILADINTPLPPNGVVLNVKKETKSMITTQTAQNIYIAQHVRSLFYTFDATFPENSTGNIQIFPYPFNGWYPPTIIDSSEPLLRDLNLEGARIDISDINIQLKITIKETKTW